MNRWHGNITLILLAALAAITAMILLTQPASAQHSRSRGPAHSHDVVLLKCDSGFKVTIYQGNTSAPTRKSGDCAESVSRLLREGFTIKDVGHYDRQTSSSTVYTFVR